MVKVVNALWRTWSVILPFRVRKFKFRRFLTVCLASFGCFTFLSFSDSAGTTGFWSIATKSDRKALSITSVIDMNISRPEEYWIHVAKGPDCAKARPQKRGTLPLVNLLSIHGSGNTWLRWLTERATGLCTGSLYGDTWLRVAGLPCEDYVTPYLFKHTVMVRSHYYHQLNASKVLLLIRNPYDAIVSDYNRVKSYNNHTGTVDASEFHSDEFQTFAEVRANEWFNEIETTCSSAEEVFIIFYENIKYNLRSILEQIAVFLRVLVPQSRIVCATKSQEGKVKRQHRQLSDIWTPYLTILVDGVICQANYFLKEHKVQDIPDFYAAACER